MRDVDLQRAQNVFGDQLVYASLAKNGRRKNGEDRADELVLPVPCPPDTVLVKQNRILNAKPSTASKLLARNVADGVTDGGLLGSA